MVVESGIERPRDVARLRPPARTRSSSASPSWRRRIPARRCRSCCRDRARARARAAGQDLRRHQRRRRRGGGGGRRRLLGLNFYPRSPRYVTPEAAAAIIAVAAARRAGGRRVRRSPRATTCVAIEVAGLDLLQFHGDERRRVLSAASPCRRSRRCACARLPISPRRGRRLSRRLPARRRRRSRCATAAPGRALALEPVAPEIAEPSVLAGGLTPETVADAVRAVRPLGVDVARASSARPGCKDPERVRSFIANAKSA